MRKSLLISPQTKARLDALKKGLSYDAFLAKVAEFLENSGASLEDGKLPVNKLIIDQASRVIEVVRGIEKKQNAILKSMAERMETAPRAVSIVSDETLSASELEQVEQVVSQNRELEAQVKSLRTELNLVRAEKAMSEKQPVATSSGISDKEEAKQLISKMRDSLKNSLVEKDKFFISKSEANAILSRIEELVQ